MIVYVDTSTLLGRVVDGPSASPPVPERTRAATPSGRRSGIVQRSIDSDVVALSKRVGPDSLRRLDAIHLATAVLIDADLLLTHDARLADAAEGWGLTVRQP